MAENKLITERQTAELIAKTIENLEIEVDLSEYQTSDDIESTKSDLEKEIAKKVDKTEYESKVSELEGAIEEKADSSDLEELEQTLTTKLTAVYRYKGTKSSYGELPNSGNEIGDVWDVNNGMNYAWNGSEWDALGESRIEVDAMLNSISNNAIANKAVYEALQGKADNSVATTSDNGLMSSEDKQKLDGFEVANQTEIDSAYNSYIKPNLTIQATTK